MKKYLAFAATVLGLVLMTGTAAAQTVPPVLNSIGPQTVAEGDNLNIIVTATDGDATIPVLSTSILPSNATFVDNLDGTGTFNFDPDFDQAGIDSITFYASDAVTADIDSELVVITVTNTNRDPVLASIGAQSVAENANLNFIATASDPDGTTPPRRHDPDHDKFDFTDRSDIYR
jgi:hypothetical protein